MVRPGIILHGLTPSPGLPFMDRFRPTLQWKAAVSFVKDLEPGDSVSYGRTYTAAGPIRAATVPVGYADGYPRLLSGRGRVLIRGRSAPIIGRVCMDQMVVDVTGIPGAAEGDTVTLIGRDGEETLPAEGNRRPLRHHQLRNHVRHLPPGAPHLFFGRPDGRCGKLPDGSAVENKKVFGRLF